ncbi:MAG: Serine/threonine-protein kinase PknD [Chroococcidiopsis cubana SAG 39.79]|jgi:serine/threonine protein kinase|uniref:Serine/threonine protein kinase n=2 Tax=Chroococcidiopsis TaxID=54298 RepID=K9U6M9_CHRTP|nr:MULTISPECIES: serine/threonine-protein kinase [Chroococcidiopsis]AFY90485.1 serine/threonine protein kinase [Chroococcidiopsis thermalis PCC 7203]MDZ4878424.1 Serine/threonine-protein kinase PknD [Chroococcidiopsis cubana SAG 39.79]PSB62792.1 serine/threonine protein kinase [Chroococcidiopsis cubana CCALA 043]RUT14223.1 serine/threonine protein kinase [Chroococcidiopsis cubana SAG 39.79]URD49998.1 serine/threonine protein kinase [Chroococcidiopsis sp. CCNUC1]
MSDRDWETPLTSNTLEQRYEIIQQLAKKAGRRTLLARDRKTEELVVVKLLSFTSDFEWDALKLFEREAKILQAISHPAIPRYLDYYELDFNNGNKGFALVQTYISGKSIEEYLKSGRSFDEVEIKQLAKAVLEILIYLHGRQPPVIHRDIKPSNILLGDRSGNSIGQVYLVDFGSVQTLAAKEGGTMTVVGTYGYMPPEQFGDRTVPASDLYSLGTTLVYLVTGTHPADLPQKDGRIQFELLTNLSLEFTQWLRRMIEPSLERRFTSAEHALQELIQPQLVDIVLSTTQQPSDSKVKLTRKADTLEILLPAKGWNFGVGFTTAFTTFYNLILVPATGIAFSPYWRISHPLIWLIVGGLWYGNYILISGVLKYLLKRVRLKISSQEIELTHEIIGWKYRHIFNASKQDVSALKLIYGYHGNRRYMHIWIGKNRYELWGDSILTEPEMEWLAQEVSSCLGIEISREPNFYIPKGD